MFVYTVGLRRRFGLGWKKYRVKGHRWDQGRLVLDIIDGFQVHIPGVKIRAFRVYPDIQVALRALEKNKRHSEQEAEQREFAAWRAEQEAMQRAQASRVGSPVGDPRMQTFRPPVDEPNLSEETGPKTPYDIARERASERVRGISSGNGQEPTAAL